MLQIKVFSLFVSEMVDTHTTAPQVVWNIILYKAIVVKKYSTGIKMDM